MIIWMAYSLLVSALVCLSALVAEHGLHLYRLPGRWTWAAAMALALAIPLGARLLRTPETATYVLWALPEISTGVATALRGSADGLPGRSGLPLVLDGWLLLGWLLASAWLAVRFGAPYTRLRGARRSWAPREIDGAEVLLSGRVGPAVVGFFGGAVAMPDWALALAAEERALIVRHEREHLRAGDHRLALLSLVACVLVPWNLFLWSARRRLRLALELDCDARVLAKGGSADRYGSLLLEVGRRGSTPRLVPAAFSEGARELERRIRAMVESPKRFRGFRAVAAGLMVSLLLALACASPRPGDAPQRPTDGESAKLTGVAIDARSGEAVSGVQIYLEGTGVGAVTAFNGRYSLVEIPPGDYQVRAQGRGYASARAAVNLVAGQLDTLDFALLPAQEAQSQFTPYTQKPQLKDRRRASAIVERFYPDLLEAAGVGGTVKVWVFVNTQGSVDTARLQESSGVPELDEAALAAASEFQFVPARNGMELVPVWITLPITFSPRSREPGEDVRSELRGALRMIATLQEHRFAEAGGYYETLTDTLRAQIPEGAQIIHFEAGENGWAAVLEKAGHECAMYYGRIAAPSAYAQPGRAICRE